MPVSPAVAAASFVAREAQRQVEAEARASSLRATFPAAAAALRQLGATEVWAFGSLVSGTPHAASDVDLAVRGVPEQNGVRAIRVVADLFPSATDLVFLEEASPGLAERILTTGRRL